MQRKSLDVWVGLFIVMGAAALMFLALKAGNLGSMTMGNTYQVTARFDNIGSLRPQAAVKASGVVVGRVASVGFDDKVYKAVVTLDMEEGFTVSLRQARWRQNLEKRPDMWPAASRQCSSPLVCHRSVPRPYNTECRKAPCCWASTSRCQTSNAFVMCCPPPGRRSSMR